MKIMPVIHGMGRNGEWRRQDFIFEFHEKEDDLYSSKVVLSAIGERIEEYDLLVGDEAEIEFYHKAQEWNGRLYNSINIRGLKVLKRAEDGSTAVNTAIELPEATPQTQKAAPQTQEAAPSAPQAQEPATKGGADDLPF